MKSFYVSKVRSFEILNDKILELKGTELSSGLRITDIEIEKNILKFELFEKIISILKFYFIDNAFQIKLKKVQSDTGIKITFMILKNEKKTNLCLSFLDGAGNLIIQKRGRNYIDNFIGPLLLEKLTNDSRNYQPFIFKLEQMNWKIWGEKLRSINLNLEHGAKFFLSNFSNWEFLEKNEGFFSSEFKDFDVLSFSVIYSHEFESNTKKKKQNIKKVLKIQKNGIIKSSISPVILLNYLNRIL